MIGVLFLDITTGKQELGTLMVVALICQIWMPSSGIVSPESLQTPAPSFP